jgi:hypothetical protein
LLHSALELRAPFELALLGPALHENIRVPGSHCGPGFNPWVLRKVADRLAQPEGRRRPFRAGR